MVGTSSSCLSLQVLHEPLIDEDPVFITTCTERELRKRKKRKFSLWVRQCTSTGFICQVRGSRVRVRIGQDIQATLILFNLCLSMVLMEHSEVNV